MIRKKKGEEICHEGTAFSRQKENKTSRRSNRPWSDSIIRENVTKSHCPVDTLEKFPKFCQLFDPERAILTLRNAYTINKRLLQSWRAKAASGFLLGFLLRVVAR